MAQVTTSKKYRIDWRDVGKGLIVAIGTAVFASLQTAFDSNTLEFNWRFVIGSAIAAAAAYLGKNFFEPSKIVISETKGVANN